MMVRRLPWLFPRLVIVGALASALALAPATLRAGAASPAVRPAHMVADDGGPDTMDRRECDRRGQNNDRRDEFDKSHRRGHRCHAQFSAPPDALIGPIELGPDGVLRFKGSGPIAVLLDDGYVLLQFDTRRGRFARAVSQTQIDKSHAYAIIPVARYLSQLFRQNITLRPIVVSGRNQVVSGLALNRAKVVIKLSSKQRGAKSRTFTTRANALGRFTVTFAVPYRPQGSARYLIATVAVSSNGVSATIPFLVSK